MPKNHGIMIVLLGAALLGLIGTPGCARCGTGGKEGAAAYVNKEPVLVSELNRALALKARQDPAFKITPEAEADMLDMIINKKLIIQAAMEKGLAREERFVNTIKAFWEQTLIRDYIDYKQKEFRNSLFVTEDEIKKYYDNLPQDKAVGTLDDLRPEIKKRIMEEKETALFDEWLKAERKKANVRICR